MNCGGADNRLGSGLPGLPQMADGLDVPTVTIPRGARIAYSTPASIALAYSRLRIAMCLTLISFGQAASHSK
jgi:hypothetical protein